MKKARYMLCMGAWILILVLTAFCAVALWLGVVGWNLHPDVVMSGHGYAAMTLGIVFSLVVGVGLMWLVFYSSRKGYDEPSSAALTDSDVPPDGPSPPDGDGDRRA